MLISTVVRPFLVFEIRMGRSSVLLVLFLCFIVSGWVLVNATTVYVQNQCSSTVCAKYWGPNNGVGGGCSELAQGQTWTVPTSPSWSAATFWAIVSGCSGQACNTGPPSGVSQFEITVDGSSSLDYYDISVLAGYNVALKVVPTNGACTTVDCQGQTASTCPNGYYPGYTVDETKTCAYGSTDYNLYLCQ